LFINVILSAAKDLDATQTLQILRRAQNDGILGTFLNNPG
jgi:hypothetical protein